jgi:hypothetical protein
MSVEHDASVCGGCSGFVALNNLSLVLLLGNCLLGEAGLAEVLGGLTMCYSVSLQVVSWIVVT